MSKKQAKWSALAMDMAREFKTIERGRTEARKALKEAMAKYKEQANYSVEAADFWQRWVKALGDGK